MTEKDKIIKIVKEYIAENLRVEINNERGSYGMSSSLSVSVFLEKEEISKDRISVDIG